MESTGVLSSEQIKRDLLDGVKELWENSLYFDFTLKVEDESIQVHKVVLASCSGYFRAMFNSSMKESSERSVELKGLKASAVKSVISFIYTGDIELSADTQDDILSAAHYLQIHSAVLLCSDFLPNSITWDSVFHLRHLARSYALDDVEKEVENFMLASFSEMPDEAVESVGKQVLKLVASNSLCVVSEYVLFEKLMLFKSFLSEDEFYEALSHVRFPLMSKDELEKVSSSGVMTSRLSHLMDEAWEYHKDVIKQPSLQTERTQLRSDKVTMVVADKTFISGVYEDQPQKFIMKNDPSKRSHLEGRSDIDHIAALDNFLYVCGDVRVPTGARYKGFSRYDPRFNVWQELDQLLDKSRRDFPLVAHGKQIFAIGGESNESMEIYDTQTNKWRYGTDINYYNMSSAAVALDDKIYVCGGADYGRRVPIYSINTVSCYDTVNETWQLMEEMTEPRCDHQIVALDGKVIVFGGKNEEYNNLLNAEYYSPDVDQWTLFHKALPYDIDGVCSNGSDIFILKRLDMDDEDMEETEAAEQDTIGFAKFNMVTGNVEHYGFYIVQPDYTATCSPFMCSTLMLPFKLKPDSNDV